MTDNNFSSLDGIYQMFNPIDLAGSQGIDLGGPLDQIGDNSNPFKLLVGLLENSGRGVYNIADIEKRIAEIKSKGEFGNVDLSKYLTIWTNKKIINIGDDTAKHKIAFNEEGSPTDVTSLQEVIGSDFSIADGPSISMILSRTPFFNPAVRNTKKSEIFLNGMPNVVLSQLVPFMQVEFQFTRDHSNLLQTAGQLKFLVGAADRSADKALDEAHSKLFTDSDGKKSELDYMGMEAFTSPQTLVNPQPNKNVGRFGNRFTEVIDPFRPFATLEGVTISVSPAGAGFFTYKKASLSLKVHDRSRLAEISDLLRPRVYTGVTIWLTYGWRAPVRGAQNPYFKYVNDNLLMREAYHIVNSSFSFDNLGQVTINLELFTKGVAELREMKITSHKEDEEFKMNEVKRLASEISTLRQKLKLDPPEGLNKEIRVYQLLDAAETGTFPDLKPSEVYKQIQSLKKTLDSTGNANQADLTTLYSKMNELYTASNTDKTRYATQDAYETRVSSTVAKMFDEVRTGLDPFLPGDGKGLGDDITKIISKLNSAPATKVNKNMKGAVSFGKLFSVFAMRAIQSMPEVINEAQIFFYDLNESCGPISGHSIAEFPIDMNQFSDQFTDLVKSRGGEKINLEDFLSLCINAQFLEKRAIGYGLRQFFKDYVKGKEAQYSDAKDTEQNYENQLAGLGGKWGPFKQPIVEMHIECSHERVSEAGQNDILQAMSYSAADSSTLSIKDANGKQARKIMRIHVYDKQTNAYKEAARLMKRADASGNDGYFSEPSTQFAKDRMADSSGIVSAVSRYATVAIDQNGTAKFTDFTNAQQAKYLVGQLMPTIRFGANGSTITQASLASKADPLLSSVQMIRTQTVKNTASPNGAGTAGIPLRVIPAQLQMTSMGNPLASAAQKYFIDFQTGTTLDNLYILTNYTHTFSPGRFDTSWTFGFADGYGVFEGAQDAIKAIGNIDPTVPKSPT